MNTAQNADHMTHHDDPAMDDVRFPDMSELNITILGPGAVFQGDIFTEKGMSISGKVIGNIVCRDGLLHIAETGVVSGNIEGYNVQVDGLAEGDVLARHTLTIKGTIRGKMGYMVELFVDPNLDIDGHIHKVKVDTVGAFAPPPQQGAYHATYSGSPAPQRSAPPVGQHYGHTAYTHVPVATAPVPQEAAAPAPTLASVPPRPGEPVSPPQRSHYGSGNFSHQLHRAA
ncbi:MAG: polymer-forming cytoskeletal protein [Pseudomonadota bacterium]